METERYIKKDMKESNLFDFSNFPKNIPKTDKDYYYSEDNIFVGSNCLCQYEGRSDPKVPLGPVAFAKYLAYITTEPH